MDTVSFKISKKDAIIVAKIVDRAEQMAKDNGHDIDRLSTTMDLTACHANGCKMRLADLLEADDFNFAHDVFGISQHINRETGELMDFFSPRFHA